MKYVKITKTKHRPDAKCPAAKMDSWKHGTEHPENLSLPVDYTVEGWIENPPEYGKSLRMTRLKRNGVSAFGLFVTSPVKEINEGRLDGFDGVFTTENSVYRIEPATPPVNQPTPIWREAGDFTD